MRIILNIKTRIHNARKVVEEIKAGEWKLIRSMPDGIPYAAVNRRYPKYVLWLTGGSLFCRMNTRKDYEKTHHFGWILGIYVWFAAARKLYREGNHRVAPRMIPKL